MLNLLPQEEKKRLVNEYRLRFLITVVMFVCALLVIAIVGLFPTYISKKEEMKHLMEQKEQADSENSTGTLEDAEALKTSNKAIADYLMSRIETLQSSSLQTAIIGKIVSKKTSAISITGIDMSGTQVTVRGVAATRSDLIAFHSALRKEPQFKDALLPIGDIAKSTDAQFTIEIILP